MVEPEGGGCGGFLVVAAGQTDLYAPVAMNVAGSRSADSVPGGMVVMKVVAVGQPLIAVVVAVVVTIAK